ncbi:MULTISPECIES: sigma-70 family RNA polymerase sigma factor [Pigmentiphaga]|uniref:RNA polymerase sigma-70 factor (ECF subfamily) n=1 Tax=Pigmentiphaga kullae TaxID=151784 RepID=A0A4Q7NI64_9BURK|nr:MULTISPECIES: sigma-70 family RNA polymerase sigma factor [Pigmentiphaga]RZS84694.1 RNA polymerase sigma-70 factor (ECF subfamily) [Pigmentiphaga kullae]
MDSRAVTALLPRLRRYARALAGDRAAADDLVQDTLERAWARLHTWHTGRDLGAWLLSIMHNLRVDQLRGQRLNTVPWNETLDDMPSRPTQADGIELEDLEHALAQLPEEQRAVLLLVALEGMRYAEVADTLGIPLGTVMSRLSRGRERLRLILDGQPPAAGTLRMIK